MGHFILVQLILAICLGWWCAVRYAPGVLSLLLPRQVTFWFGAGLFVFGCFSAFLATQADNPAGFISGLIQCFVGGWLMLVPAAAVRGSQEYDHAMKTLGALLASLAAGMVFLFFVRTFEDTVAVSLWLLMLGTLLTLRWQRTCR
jgi:hypothetical protein